MDFIQVFVLALVQGLTEFLPISSSAHLILVPRFLGWPEQGLAFDVAVHVGTLLAVIGYFRKLLPTLYRDWIASIKQKNLIGQSHLAWGVMIATIPVGIAGLLLNDWIEISLRSPLVIAYSTIVFGLLLWIAHIRSSKNKQSMNSMNLQHIIIIGCAQALALIPGTSRSGITMTAALLCGYNPVSAAQFSFLLSIPVILLAGALKCIHLLQQTTQVDILALFAGIVISTLSAYLCIEWFIKWLEKIGLMPFIIYRLLLGGVLLWVWIP